MTFEQLSKELPNGFHDAQIRTITLDFVGQSILIMMDLLVGAPGDSNQEEMRPGTVKVVAPYLFFVEPPDPTYPFFFDGTPVHLDGDSVKTGQNPGLARLLPALPQGATAYRFFFAEWNSFLYVAGQGVEFQWDPDGQEP